MRVENEREALLIACEMERRAVRLYERAALLFADGELHAPLARFAAEEREHLLRFSSMGDASAAREEQSLLLSAQAAQILFPGGLTGAQREGAFDSPVALAAYAVEQEKNAVACYQSFAGQCESVAAREMFLSIAQEETAHVDAFERILETQVQQK